jgi:hypothetical protein
MTIREKGKRFYGREEKISGKLLSYRPFSYSRNRVPLHSGTKSAIYLKKR